MIRNKALLGNWLSEETAEMFAVWGQSISFEIEGSGTLYSWHTDNGKLINEQLDFNWISINEKTIKIREIVNKNAPAEDLEWDVIEFELVESEFKHLYWAKMWQTNVDDTGNEERFWIINSAVSKNKKTED